LPRENKLCELRFWISLYPAAGVPAVGPQKVYLREVYCQKDGPRKVSRHSMVFLPTAFHHLGVRGMELPGMDLPQTGDCRTACLPKNAADQTASPDRKVLAGPEVHRKLRDHPVCQTALCQTAVCRWKVARSMAFHPMVFRHTTFCRRKNDRDRKAYRNAADRKGARRTVFRDPRPDPKTLADRHSDPRVLIRRPA